MAVLRRGNRSSLNQNRRYGISRSYGLELGMGLLPYGIRPNEVRNLRVRILRVDPRVGKEPTNKRESSYKDRGCNGLYPSPYCTLSISLSPSSKKEI